MSRRRPGCPARSVAAGRPAPARPGRPWWPRRQVQETVASAHCRPDRPGCPVKNSGRGLPNRGWMGCVTTLESRSEAVAESSITWADGALLAIDQRVLPRELRWLRHRRRRRAHRGDQDAGHPGCAGTRGGRRVRCGAGGIHARRRHRDDEVGSRPDRIGPAHRGESGLGCAASAGHVARGPGCRARGGPADAGRGRAGQPDACHPCGRPGAAAVSRPSAARAHALQHRPAGHHRGRYRARGGAGAACSRQGRRGVGRRDATAAAGSPADRVGVGRGGHCAPADDRLRRGVGDGHRAGRLRAGRRGPHRCRRLGREQDRHLCAGGGGAPARHPVHRCRARIDARPRDGDGQPRSSSKQRAAAEITHVGGVATAPDRYRRLQSRVRRHTPGADHRGGNRKRSDRRGEYRCGTTDCRHRAQLVRAWLDARYGRQYFGAHRADGGDHRQRAVQGRAHRPTIW